MAWSISPRISSKRVRTWILQQTVPSLQTIPVRGYFWKVDKSLKLQEQRPNSGGYR
jgi:hypothetical protein